MSNNRDSAGYIKDLSFINVCTAMMNIANVITADDLVKSSQNDRVREIIELYHKELQRLMGLQTLENLNRIKSSIKTHYPKFIRAIKTEVNLENLAIFMLHSRFESKKIKHPDFELFYDADIRDELADALEDYASAEMFELADKVKGFL